MKPGRQSAGVWRGFIAMLLSACVAGCAYHLDDPVDAHYQRYKARMPEGDRVFACHAYGCKIQTPFRFTDADIAKLQSLMPAAKTKTAADERAAIRETLASMEHRVDAEVGTANDRPGDDFAGSGDPSQMDCVDVATNLSSYMLVLDGHQLLRHHSVGGVYVKEDYRKGVSGWTHYAGILIEKGSNQKYAVDGWLLAWQAAGDHRSREVVHRRLRVSSSAARAQARAHNPTSVGRQGPMLERPSGRRREIPKSAATSHS